MLLLLLLMLFLQPMMLLPDSESQQTPIRYGTCEDGNSKQVVTSFASQHFYAYREGHVSRHSRRRRYSRRRGMLSRIF